MKEWNKMEKKNKREEKKREKKASSFGCGFFVET
jgi:hypothetical protein